MKRSVYIDRSSLYFVNHIAPNSPNQMVRYAGFVISNTMSCEQLYTKPQFKVFGKIDNTWYLFVGLRRDDELGMHTDLSYTGDSYTNRFYWPQVCEWSNLPPVQS